MRGFTLVEVLVVAGIFAALLSFVMPNLTGNQRHTQNNEAIALLVADMRDQQMKAMLGDTEGQSVSTSSGIYFETTRYTLFRGNTYSAVDNRNYVISLDPQFQFTATNLPSSQVVFTEGSGEVSNFVNDTYSITLSDTQSGNSQVITINKYGVVQSVN
jgi:prepilin-type N-terminal cleavage/methylation domain-containing protein